MYIRDPVALDIVFLRQEFCFYCWFIVAALIVCAGSWAEPESFVIGDPENVCFLVSSVFHREWYLPCEVSRAGP